MSAALCSAVLILGIVWLVPDTAFTEDAELPVLRRSFAEPSAPVPPFPEGRFEPREGETLSWIGGTEVFDMDGFGYTEARLLSAWPSLHLHWRNLAWRGDTVYLQARPLYYYTKQIDPRPGSVADHRIKTEPGIIFLCFGKMESLEGEARLSDFSAAYGKLIDDLAALTPRLVLVQPTPFLASGPAADLSDSRNAVLQRYREAIAALARDRGLLLITLPDDAWTTDNSDNGIHCNESGHRIYAQEMAKALNAPAASIAEPSPDLLQTIRVKNRLWHQYYQPTNWAFLFGDRQHVPASRDPEKREERWFLRELDTLPGLLAAEESKIHQQLAKEVKK